MPWKEMQNGFLPIPTRLLDESQKIVGFANMAGWSRDEGGNEIDDIQQRDPTKVVIQSILERVLR